MDIFRATSEHIRLAREAITSLHSRELPPALVLEAFLSNPACYMILAVRDDHVVGSLTGYALEQYWSFQEFFLYEIDVLEQHRNQGIGAGLVEAFAQHARAAGAGNVWVLTNRSNKAAVRTYAKCGFEPSAETDEVMMTLTLNDSAV